jgi:hypothetical protein
MTAQGIKTLREEKERSGNGDGSDVSTDDPSGSGATFRVDLIPARAENMVVCDGPRMGDWASEKVKRLSGSGRCIGRSIVLPVRVSAMSWGCRFGSAKVLAQRLAN